MPAWVSVRIRPSGRSGNSDSMQTTASGLSRTYSIIDVRVNAPPLASVAAGLEAKPYVLLNGERSTHTMPFSASRSRTPEVSSSGSKLGSSWPRWTVQPVPLYSMYMSISPDSSASRATAVPPRLTLSSTFAPAAS